jgi:hypothetical protein
MTRSRYVGKYTSVFVGSTYEIYGFQSNLNLSRAISGCCESKNLDHGDRSILLICPSKSDRTTHVYSTTISLLQLLVFYIPASTSTSITTPTTSYLHPPLARRELTVQVFPCVLSSYIQSTIPFVPYYCNHE